MICAGKLSSAESGNWSSRSVRNSCREVPLFIKVKVKLTSTPAGFFGPELELFLLLDVV